MEVESGQEGADARAWGKDATHEATPHACPAAAAPVPPEGSVAAILEAVRVLGERADAEDPQEAAGDGPADGETVAAGAGGTGTHLASLQSVGDMRRRSGRKDRKERVDIVEMARRVRNWGICKPQRASHSAWKWGFKYWGFKYARPPAGPAGYHNQALCSICLQNDLGGATIKMGADKSTWVPSLMPWSRTSRRDGEMALIY